MPIFAPVYYASPPVFLSHYLSACTRTCLPGSPPVYLLFALIVHLCSCAGIFFSYLPALTSLTCFPCLPVYTCFPDLYPRLFSAQVIIVYGLIAYKPLSADDPEKYPWWTDVIGWTMAGSSMIMIPFVAVYKIIRVPGPASLKQVLTKAAKARGDSCMVIRTWSLLCFSKEDILRVKLAISL